MHFFKFFIFPSYSGFLGMENNLFAGICRIIFHSLIFSLRSLNTFWCFTLIFLYEAITKLFFPYGFYLKIPISLLCFKLMCKCWCHVPQRKYCGGGGWRYHIYRNVLHSLRTMISLQKHNLVIIGYTSASCW